MSPPTVPKSKDNLDGADDSGWVKVKSKSRQRQRPPPIPPNHHLAASLRNDPSHSRSVSEIDAEYHKLRTQWRDSTGSASLGSISQSIGSSNPGVTRAICLGIGSFDPPDGAWEAKKTTFIQFIAFQAMVEELEKCSKSTIPCFFQEPLFTDSDKQFIQSLGHTVVESPEGSNMIQSDSMLFGIHLYRPLYAQALERSLPAIFVGTGWPVWDRLSPSQPDDLSNLEAIEDTYNKTVFPSDSYGKAFSDTSIYWRPTPAVSSTKGDTSREQPKPALKD